MRAAKYSLLICIQALLAKHNNNYATASQAKYLELLETIHGEHIGRRMLNYHLADLQREGLIERIKRTHRNADGTLCLMTSAICLTIKGCLYLVKKKVTWAVQHLNKLRKKYIPYCPQPQNTKTTTITQEKTDDGDAIKRRVAEAHQRKASLYSDMLAQSKIPRAVTW